MARRSRLAIIGVLSISLSGCGNMIADMAGIPIVEPDNYGAVRNHMVFNFEREEGVIWVVAPMIFHDRDPLGNVYAVRGWIDPDDTIRSQMTQIFVSARFTDWAYLDQAQADGVPLEFTMLDREEGTCGIIGCPVWETVGVNLTPDQLSEAVENGLAFEISGPAGSVAMTVPSTYFRAYHDEYAAAVASD